MINLKKIPRHHNLYIIRSYKRNGDSTVKLGFSDVIHKRMKSYMSHNVNTELIRTFFREDAFEFEKWFHSTNKSSYPNEWYDSRILNWMLFLLEMDLKYEFPIFTFYHGDGRIEENKSWEYMSKKYNLIKEPLKRMIRGDEKQLHGWAVISSQKGYGKNKAKFNWNHTSGLEYKGKTAKEVADLMGCSYNTIRKLQNDRSKRRAGWMITSEYNVNDFDPEQNNNCKIKMIKEI